MLSYTLTFYCYRFEKSDTANTTPGEDPCLPLKLAFDFLSTLQDISVLNRNKVQDMQAMISLHVYLNYYSLKSKSKESLHICVEQFEKMLSEASHFTHSLSILNCIFKINSFIFIYDSCMHTGDSKENILKQIVILENTIQNLLMNCGEKEEVYVRDAFISLLQSIEASSLVTQGDIVSPIVKIVTHVLQTLLGSNEWTADTQSIPQNAGKMTVHLLRSTLTLAHKYITDQHTEKNKGK